MKRHILFPLNEESKRVVLRSLDRYRQELLRSDTRVNKPLYREIVRQEVELVKQLCVEIERRWKEGSG